METFKKLLTKKIINVSIAVLLIVIVVVGLSIGNHYAFDIYAANLTTFLCDNGQSDSESAEQAKASGNELAQQIVEEGAVLVKNDDGCLPLSKSTKKVNIFGYKSIDWVYCTTGSAGYPTDSSQTVYSITEAIEDYGYSYNTKITDFYKSWNTPWGYQSTLGCKNYLFYRLFEPKLSEYQDIFDDSKSYSDTAIVVISRWAGESQDIPHTQFKYKYDQDNSRGYLTISTEEETLLKAVGAAFDKVVVIINSTNTMQLDFMDTIPGLDACLVVGGTGLEGGKALPKLLWGDATPSGRLADTYARKLEYHYTHYQMSNDHVQVYQGAPSSSKTMTGISRTNWNRNVTPYVDFVEGIYVGYKWFETADAEGYWDRDPYNGYTNVVQYPFGYGLSYTDFTWEVTKCSIENGSSIKDNQEITYEVKVTNVGTVSGKDVVEVYLTAPYTKGGIEKSSVKLVGFAKTPELAPGLSATLTITVDTSDFKSFDDYDKNNNDFAGYELEEGTYQLKFMENCHTLKEDMVGANTFEYKVDSTILIETDEVTGNTVTTLFTGDNAVDGISIDGSNVDQNIEFLTRESFNALPTSNFTARAWTSKLAVSDGKSNAVLCNAYSTTQADEWDNATGKDAFDNEINTTAPTWGKNSNLKVMENGKLTDLGRKLAADYNAEEWDALLDQVKFSEAVEIMDSSSAYLRPNFTSVGLNEKYKDAETSAQVNGFAGSTATGFPIETVTAQTWNTALALAFGKAIANEMNVLGFDGGYSPGANIHRDPYGGRNGEYCSEDGFLTGKIVANIVKGYTVSGKYAFVKHFAANDSEFARVGVYTWMREQALRENDLRAFEEVVKNGKGIALMTSFNRVGATWAGGNEALIQGVLRNEWGFNGMIITDMIENDKYMDGAQAIRAGGNYMLGGNGATKTTMLPSESKSSARLQNRLRESAKEVIYATIVPLYENENYNESADASDVIVSYPSKSAYEWWKPTLVSVEIIIYCLLAYGVFWLVFPSKSLIEEFKKYNEGKKMTEESGNE